MSLPIPAVMRKYTCGQDTFIRHRCVTELIAKSAGTVLDVGGEGLLSNYLPGMKTVSVNVRSADIIAQGDRLPFRNNAFDVVVSCDTIEHLPKEERLSFCTEVHRVARRTAVICGPLGTNEHIEYEKSLLLRCDLNPEVLTYVREHVEFGIPKPSEIVRVAEKFGAALFYEGDFRSVAQRGYFSRIPYVRLVLSVLKNWFTDARFHPSRFLMESYSAHTNRFYLVIQKENALRKSGL